MKSIRVLIADDHALVRDGIRALLDADEEITVVAEAQDGLEAIEKIRSHQPSIVLMDIGMARMNGLEATIQITKRFPGIKVAMLSMHANEEYVLQALRSGASGYLLKDTKKQDLIRAVKLIASGKTFLSPEVSRHVIDNYVQSVGTPKSLIEQITPRQREILKLIAEGRTNKEMAQLLNISVKTVDTHRTQLMERLDIHDVAGLVRYAIKTGLVTIGS